MVILYCHAQISILPLNLGDEGRQDIILDAVDTGDRQRPPFRAALQRQSLPVEQQDALGDLRK